MESVLANVRRIGRVPATRLNQDDVAGDRAWGSLGQVASTICPPHCLVLGTISLMPRRKKDQPPGRPGPAPKDPTPEQMARIPELKERAHEIGLLGDENDLLLAAARLVEQVQVRIGAAMAIRGKRKVDPNRPGREPAEEIVNGIVRDALAFAATVPGLDREIVRVSERPATAARRRRG